MELEAYKSTSVSRTFPKCKVLASIHQDSPNHDQVTTGQVLSWTASYLSRDITSVATPCGKRYLPTSEDTQSIASDCHRSEMAYFASDCLQL